MRFENIKTYGSPLNGAREGNILKYEVKHMKKNKRLEHFHTFSMKKVENNYFRENFPM